MSQTNFLTLKVDIRKNQNTKSAAYGKYYPIVSSEKVLTTKGLANHMREHGCLVGPEAIQAVLAKFAECIPEIVGQGYGVFLDGLGKFYPTIKVAKLGSKTKQEVLADDFNVADMVGGVHIRFLPSNEAMDGLTSKKFKERCSIQSNNVVELQTVEDKTIKKLTPISDWIWEQKNPQQP